MQESADRRPAPASEEMDDDELVALARQGSEQAVRVLIQRYNRQLFRIARGVVRDDDEAEDVVQDAWVRAFTRLESFRGEAAFSTWLTRIALNEALGRLRRRRPAAPLADIESLAGAQGGRIIMFPLSPLPADPESETGRRQLRRLIEKAVDELPDSFRMVFILRDVEGLSTGETATVLAIRPETVKTRLYRARRLMRRSLERRLAPRFAELFPFAGERCAAMADRVVASLQAGDGAP